MPEVLIPKTYIDDALARTDIVDVIDSRVRLKKTGKNFSACCPFHDEKSPSFSVSQEKQFYYCFGCGASGDAIGFLVDYERLAFRDAALMIGRAAGLPDPDNTQTSAQVDASIRWQEYRQLKTRLLNAKLYLGLSGDAAYQSEKQRIEAIIARKYADFVAHERRAALSEMMRDEQMEIVAHRLKSSEAANRDICLRLPTWVSTDTKRVLLAEQRIKKIQELINESK